VATATRILRKAYADAIRMTTLSGPEVLFLSPFSNGFETDAASRLPVYRHLHKIPISQQASVNNVFDGGRHDGGFGVCAAGRRNHDEPPEESQLESLSKGAEA